MRILICSAALTALILMAVPGSRSFASELAAKIVHLRPGAPTGPIPFILDLHKHKRPAKAPAKPAKPANAPRNASKPNQPAQ